MNMYIDGRYQPASDGSTVNVVNPSTGEVIDTVPSATIEDVERALDIAQIGKNKWAATPVAERRRILYQVAADIEQKTEQWAPILAKEAGKTLPFAKDEFGAAKRIFEGYADCIMHQTGDIMPRESFLGTGTDIVMVQHEPLGVVACVTPFNFPVELYVQKVAPALAAGNAVIVKPASDTPLASILITELIVKAGVPKEAIQILTGKGSLIGDRLATSEKIQAISLTGSTEVGVHIIKSAADNMTRTFMELGGNDAMIVFDDCDLEAAASEAVFGRTCCAGQVCCGTKRFIVQNSVKEKFTELVLERVQQLKVGDPFEEGVDLGPVINEAAAKRAEEQVQMTVQQGAKCLWGGHQYNGAFFEPTVLTNVTPDMDIARDLEVFAPVIPIIGFETEEEAINIANGSCYGLSGAVMTSDIGKGLRVSGAVDTGTMVINGCSIYRTHDMPFGGHKKSGFGSEGFYATLEEYMQTKSIVMKGVLKK